MPDPQLAVRAQSQRSGHRLGDLRALRREQAGQYSHTQTGAPGPRRDGTESSVTQLPSACLRAALKADLPAPEAAWTRSSRDFSLCLLEISKSADRHRVKSMVRCGRRHRVKSMLREANL